jgi:hypothetical protein
MFPIVSESFAGSGRGPTDRKSLLARRGVGAESEAESVLPWAQSDKRGPGSQSRQHNEREAEIMMFVLHAQWTL